jgi:orotidine-5'-phosphate decarboxylase
VSADQIIVALDMAREEALALADTLRGRVRWLKVGMTLYYAEGPGIVAELRERGFDVFVDLKLHDIPHQVAGAAASLAGVGGGMLTVHASGGAEMMRAAVESSRRAAEEIGLSIAPKILAVTVLTSMGDEVLGTVGIVRSAAEQVRVLCELALEAGVDGVVCSPQEAAEVRRLLGADALVVTPGVRPAWSAADDQARVASPARALAAGASHLVIGRPITAAPSPSEAVDRIIAEIEGATL